MPFISLRSEQVRAMLSQLGLGSLEELFAHIPPEVLRSDFSLPPSASQLDMEREIETLGSVNRRCTESLCFLGGGAYDHYIPAAVREILRRGEFYTSYTPYQPEVSQGLLQAIFEYQTQLSRLTALQTAIPVIFSVL